MYGYAGKILRVDLTNRMFSVLNTEDYEQWGGGHGFGSAVFWDLCKDKTVSALDPGNVLTVMTSPLSGTLVPSASRCEVQGIAPEGYPVEWFTRSNFGGRFAPMLRWAGWDGIAIEGKADKPVWIDIRDSNVEIKDAKWLWGRDTWETQEQIWREVSTGQNYNDWWKPGDKREDPFWKQVAKMFTKRIGPWLTNHKLISVKFEQAIARRFLSSEVYHERTTQKPAVLTIGPAGENLCREACLVHDAANGAGQGGFGAVFGSKNLKAISVIGTGSISVADPKALLAIRMNNNNAGKTETHTNLAFWSFPDEMRIAGCTGCKSPCRGRYTGSYGNQSICNVTAFSMIFNKKGGADDSDAERKGADLLQKYGLNAVALWIGYEYLTKLHEAGVLGKGMQIDCDYPFEKANDVEFVEKYIKSIAYREGIGNDLAEGFPRAAEKWGRGEEDFKTGILSFPYWGYGEHYDPRAEVYWGYSSILSCRDCNDHTISALFIYPTSHLHTDTEPPIPAGELVEIFSAYMYPYEGDTSLLDFSTENIYSDNMAKLVYWHRCFDSFWRNSALYCDIQWPTLDPNEAKVAFNDIDKFWNAVTGDNYSFLEGLKVGERIWNLDNAIWIMQGRHRDIIHFADYIYEVPFSGTHVGAGKQPVESSDRIFTFKPGYYGPGRENGRWKYLDYTGRKLDKEKFDEFKTRFYRLQGWDPDTGWPTRGSLESIGLGQIADELEKHGKLGKG